MCDCQSVKVLIFLFPFLSAVWWCWMRLWRENSHSWYRKTRYWAKSTNTALAKTKDSVLGILQGSQTCRRKWSKYNQMVSRPTPWENNEQQMWLSLIGQEGFMFPQGKELMQTTGIWLKHMDPEPQARVSGSARAPCGLMGELLALFAEREQTLPTYLSKSLYNSSSRGKMKLSFTGCVLFCFFCCCCFCITSISRGFDPSHLVLIRWL